MPLKDTEARRAYDRAYRAANCKSITNYLAGWLKENQEKRRQIVAKWRKKHRANNNKKSKERYKRYEQEYLASICAKAVIRQQTGLSARDMPLDLIEAKAKLIMTKRLLREKGVVC